VGRHRHRRDFGPTRRYKTPGGSKYSLSDEGSRYPPSTEEASEGRAPKKTNVTIRSEFPKQAKATEWRQTVVDSNMYEEDEVGVFAEEVGDKGARTFYVDTFDHFAKTLRLSDHFGEVFLEDRPCWLYFDLEYSTLANPHLDSAEVLSQFRWLLRNFTEHLDTPFDESRVIYLDSSRAAKFSFHVIVKGISPFANNVEAGVFVDAMFKYAKSDAAAERTDLLFVRSDVDGDRLVPIADAQVYSRNRVFRVLGQKKRASRVILTLADGGTVVKKTDKLPDQVLRTLASRVPRDASLFNHSIIREGAKSARARGSGIYRSESVSVDPLWAPLVKYLPGRWDEERAEAEGDVPNADTVVKDVRRAESSLTVFLENNRYCTGRGRSHKSNGIYLVANLQKHTFQQRCWDKADCGCNIDSRSYEFPSELVPDRSELVRTWLKLGKGRKYTDHDPMWLLDGNHTDADQAGAEQGIKLRRYRFARKPGRAGRLKRQTKAGRRKSNS
jgi:hypothetical protein